MEEKTLVAYRYTEDEKYQKSKKTILILLAVAIIGLLFFFVMNNAEYPMNVIAIFSAIVGGWCLAMWLIFFPMYIMSGKMSLTVTTHRVYGRTMFTEINLPMDSITSTGKANKRSIYFSSASGKVTFGFYTQEKADEVYQIVSQQISNRQNNKGSVTVVNNNSNADELKKYKDLLDSGIITQEEFDAKKKQLLGM